MSNAEHLMENALIVLSKNKNTNTGWESFSKDETNIYMAKQIGISLETVWDMAVYVDMYGYRIASVSKWE